MGVSDVDPPCGEACIDGKLRELSRVINGEAYDALGRFVREICVLPCDEALVRGVYARVCAEPGFAGTPLPELWVTGDVLALRLFRPDLEDILANLLRNALSAGATSLAETPGITAARRVTRRPRRPHGVQESSDRRGA